MFIHKAQSKAHKLTFTALTQQYSLYHQTQCVLLTGDSISTAVTQRFIAQGTARTAAVNTQPTITTALSSLCANGVLFASGNSAESVGSVTSDTVYTTVSEDITISGIDFSTRLESLDILAYGRNLTGK